MLTIKQVTLDNFCQHEHLDVELPVGLIGLVGANGRGKSNIANAIRGALTGTFERHVGDVAAGCIRQGQDENAVVEVKGALAATPFRLRREITAKSIKHRLWLEGELYSDKAKEIELWLTEASGLTPSLMSEFMFIRQQELYSFLDATDTERSKKFTALCGTKIYERLRDEYFDMLKTDKAKFDTVNETILEQLEQQVIFQGAVIAALDEDICALEKEAVAVGSEEVWTTRIDKQQAELQKIEDIQRMCRQIEQGTEKTAVLEEDLLRIEGDILSAQKKQHIRSAGLAKILRWAQFYSGQLETLDEVIDFCTQATIANAKLQQLKKEAKNAFNALEEAEQDLYDAQKVEQDFRATHGMDDYPADKEIISAKLFEAKQEHAVVREKQKTLEPLIGLVETHNDKQCCPLCKADKEHWNVSLSSLKQQSQKYEQQSVRLEQEIVGYQTELKERSNRQKQHENLKEACDRYDTLRHRSGMRYDEAKVNYRTQRDTMRHVEDADEQLRQLNALSKESTQYDIEFAKLQERAQQAKSQIAAIKAEIQDVRAQIPGMKGRDLLTMMTKIKAQHRDIQEEILDARQGLSDARGVTSRRDQLYGNKEEALRQWQSVQRRLEDAKNQLAESGDTQQWFEYCDKALAWLRKDGLPKLVHVSVLKQLCSVVNEELSLFDDPFRVTVSEDLSFIAHFDDERVIPSKALSGGQKVMLALSFWSAVSRVFAKNLGVMILDEPTDGLDADNNERLYTIMMQWRALLHQRKQQVIIITHDERMSGVFDRIIQL